MNKLNIQRQADRRDEILSAAQRCFVRSGFHQASMQEICAEAGMSAGNLYRYFPSRLIASPIAPKWPRTLPGPTFRKVFSLCLRAWLTIISPSARSSR